MQSLRLRQYYMAMIAKERCARLGKPRPNAWWWRQGTISAPFMLTGPPTDGTMELAGACAAEPCGNYNWNSKDRLEMHVWDWPEGPKPITPNQIDTKTDGTWEDRICRISDPPEVRYDEYPSGESPEYYRPTPNAFRPPVASEPEDERCCCYHYESCDCDFTYGDDDGDEDATSTRPGPLHQPVTVRRDTYYVDDTRVSVASIVLYHRVGDTPETLAENFDLSLDQVTSALKWAEENPRLVAQDLAWRDEQWAKLEQRPKVGHIDPERMEVVLL